MATFNIDEMKSGFQPVDIVFRGKDYLLGNTALGILEACEIHGEMEDNDGVAYVRAFMDAMPRMLAALCPDMPSEGLETAEQFALMKVCTEVLGRVGQLTFQAEE